VHFSTKVCLQGTLLKSTENNGFAYQTSHIYVNFCSHPIKYGNFFEFHEYSSAFAKILCNKYILEFLSPAEFGKTNSKV